MRNGEAVDLSFVELINNICVWPGQGASWLSLGTCGDVKSTLILSSFVVELIAFT